MNTIDKPRPKIKARDVPYLSDDLLMAVARDKRVSLRSVGLFAKVLASGRMTFTINYVKQICMIGDANAYGCIEELCLLGYLDNVVRMTDGDPHVVLWVKRETNETHDDSQDHPAYRDA